MNDLNAKAVSHESRKQLAPGSACLEEKAAHTGGDISLSFTYPALELAFVHLLPADQNQWAHMPMLPKSQIGVPLQSRAPAPGATAFV